MKSSTLYKEAQQGFDCQVGVPKDIALKWMGVTFSHLKHLHPYPTFSLPHYIYATFNTYIYYFK